MADFLMVDLKNSFNHKLFGTYDGDFWDYEKMMIDQYNLLNIGATTHMIHPDLLPASSECININGIPFTFPDKSINLYDNISCENQLISIVEGKFQALHLLGMSEWGNICESIRLNYSDNNSESIDIAFRDWNPIGNTSWKYDEMQAQCSSAFSVEDNIGIKKHFYLHSLSILSKDKFLNSIELPFNPSIHILAISLTISI